MRALCWHGIGDVRVDNVPDPKIQHPQDAVIKITSSGICGSDLHLLNGFVPTMESGDILGHEPMGEVVEVGNSVRNLKRGDRVVVPFTISCGNCFYCKKHLYSLCDVSNPNSEMARKQMDTRRRPFRFLTYDGWNSRRASRILTCSICRYWANQDRVGLPMKKSSSSRTYFRPDTWPQRIVKWKRVIRSLFGGGPVAQFAIKSAWLLGAGRVIAVDCVEERLTMAATEGKAETINFENEDVYDRLMEMTNGRGPDRCIDAVGCEAHASSSVTSIMDKAKEQVRLQGDRPYVMQEAIKCCRKGGTISMPGAYLGGADAVPLGAFMNKGLTLKSGQTHMQHYMKNLLELIEAGKIDPSFGITHRVKLEDAPDAYKKFRDKKDGCIKVVLQP